MNILLMLCTLQIHFNLNKINHRNVRDLFFIVCCWQEPRAFKIKQKLTKYFYIGITLLFFVLNAEFGQIFGINEGERECSQKAKEAEDKFGSLKILTVFRLALHRVN